MTSPATRLATHRISIALPPGYRRRDAIAFHGRDSECVAEAVGPAHIRKALLQDGMAIELDIAFAPPSAASREPTPGVAPPGAPPPGHPTRIDQTYATCTISADAHLSNAALMQLEQALRNMLGLRIDPLPFMALTQDDPLMGPLTRAQAGLRIIQSATPFEALTWAIIGQQINLSFAIGLRRSFILQAGRRHAGGLWCYPEAADVARLDADALTSRKFSRAKAETLLRLARLVDAGELTLELPPSGDIEAISAALLAVKGIGPWTVNYALLRGYGYADCSLHGDVAIRTALGRLLGEADKPDLARTETWLARYRPQRAMAAAHLWASLNHPLRPKTKNR